MTTHSDPLARAIKFVQTRIGEILRLRHYNGKVYTTVACEFFGIEPNDVTTEHIKIIRRIAYHGVPFYNLPRDLRDDALPVQTLTLRVTNQTLRDIVNRLDNK